MPAHLVAAGMPLLLGLSDAYSPVNIFFPHKIFLKKVNFKKDFFKDVHIFDQRKKYFYEMRKYLL